MTRVSRRGDERGAVAAIVALTLVLVVSAASFAVDLGMQRVVRSELQALTDVVALDTARLLDGRTAKQIRDGDASHLSLDAATAASASRNNTGLGTVSSVIPVLIYLASDSNGANIAKLTSAGAVMPVPDGATPDAVMITATGSVNFAFRPGSGSATRTSIAAADSSACFELGSFAASVTPANSPLFQSLLGPLIGNSTLTAVGYQGLATTSVTLLDVLSAPSLGLGTVSSVLASGPVTLGNLYLAEAYALTKDGEVAQANVLRLAAVSAVAPLTISLSQLLGLGTATDAALTTQFSALDLLVGSAFLANGTNLVGIPNLQAGLPSVGVTNTSLSVIERPQAACNQDDAKTAQISLTSDAKLSLAIPTVKSPVINLSLRGSDGNPDGTINLHLNSSIAGAHGHLTKVTCAPDVFTADIYNDLLQLSLTGSAHLSGSVNVDLKVLGITLSEVRVPVSLDITLASDASKPAATAPTSVTYSVPPKTYGTPVTMNGSATPILPALTVSLTPGSLVVGPVTVNVLGANVTLQAADLLSDVTPLINTAISSIASSVSPLVNPLIDNVNGIIGPLANGLGINVAGADMYGLPYPACSSPRLAG